MKSLRGLCAVSLLLCVALFGGGCSAISYRDPSTGAEFKSTSFLNKRAIGELEVEAAAGGDKKIRMKGYANEQTEAVAAVAGAVASALNPAK
jgi:hypothetical protein